MSSRAFVSLVLAGVLGGCGVPATGVEEIRQQSEPTGPPPPDERVRLMEGTSCDVCAEDGTQTLMRWSYVSGSVASSVLTLSGCNHLEHVSSTPSESQTCTRALPCSFDSTLTDLLVALRDPDVEAAVTHGSPRYGRDRTADGFAVLLVEYRAARLEIADPEIGSAPDIPIPKGIVRMRAALDKITRFSRIQNDAACMTFRNASAHE